MVVAFHRGTEKLGIGGHDHRALGGFGGSRVEIRQAVIVDEEWGEAAETACASIRAQSRKGGSDAAALRQGYEHGHIHVWGFYIGDARVATAIVGFEDYPDGRCMAVHVAAGKAVEVNLTDTFLPAWEQIAAGRGCRWVKFETVRDGLKAKALAAGYVERSIFVKEVQDGR